MSDDTRALQGELQMAVMRAVWRLGGGTVDDVRAAIPAELQSGYNTIQTVLNRLAERGLLERTPGRTPRGPGGKIMYRATLSESDYLARSIERTLADASPDARRAALTQLVGRFEEAMKPKRSGKGRTPK
jgi:predicted transcriptional regulator